MFIYLLRMFSHVSDNKTASHLPDKHKHKLKHNLKGDHTSDKQVRKRAALEILMNTAWRESHQPPNLVICLFSRRLSITHVKWAQA